ncbi:UNVERIFIED_CONTAM: hypothetical protein I5919_12420 [Aeromonas hydrophila]
MNTFLPCRRVKPRDNTSNIQAVVFVGSANFTGLIQKRVNHGISIAGCGINQHLCQLGAAHFFTARHYVIHPPFHHLKNIVNTQYGSTGISVALRNNISFFMIEYCVHGNDRKYNTHRKGNRIAYARIQSEQAVIVRPLHNDCRSIKLTLLGLA